MNRARILMTSEGEKFFVKDISKDYHTKYGFLSKDALASKSGSKIASNTGKEFFVFDPSFADLYRKIERAPQIIPIKDAALIIAETGIGKKSKIVDAGAGSGALSCIMGNLAKEVTAYEIREDFLAIAKRNADMLGLKNVNIKHKSIYDGIDEKNIDVVTLDLPEPWKAIGPAEKALKAGGFLVSYSPTIPQVSDFVTEILKNKKLVHLKTVEIAEREWEVFERKVRPKSTAIGHSGFLTFVRKIGN